MKYTNLYDKQFLEDFNSNQRKVFDSLELPDNKFDIDIESIIRKMNLTLKKQPMVKGDSGKRKEKVILINSNEPKRRQRFTMAHELGHCVLDEQMKQNYRTLNLKKHGIDYSDLIKETNANSFAANILMPKKLLLKLIPRVMKKFEINPRGFSDQEETQIIQEAAKQMNVSKQSMSYRLKDLHLFSSIND